MFVLSYYYNTNMAQPAKITLKMKTIPVQTQLNLKTEGDDGEFAWMKIENGKLLYCNSDEGEFEIKVPNTILAVEYYDVGPSGRWRFLDDKGNEYMLTSNLKAKLLRKEVINIKLQAPYYLK
jgi:hypothetical protein